MTADYFDWPGEHYSTLKHILTSPLAYRRACDVPLADRDTFRLGRAAHTAVLEPHRFDVDFVTWTKRTKAGNMSPRSGGEWEDFCAEHAGKTILTPVQVERARAMAAAVHAHPVAAPVLCDPTARVELGMRWVQDGIACKGRLDLVTATRLVELKSCADPRPQRFAATAVNFRYLMQLSMYGAGLLATEGIEREPLIIAVQNVEPFDVVCYSLPPDTRQHGDDELKEALDLRRACTAIGQWPGQAEEREVELRLPLWAVDEQDRDWSMNVTEEVPLAGSR